MIAHCEKYPELEIADLGVKFIKGTAKNVSERQAVALLGMAAAFGITLEDELENEPEDGIPTIADGMENVPINLDCMTIPQLREFARVNNINIGGATKKDNILQAIVDAAQKEESDDGGNG